MIANHFQASVPNQVSVLLHPSTVPVIDIFRSLGNHGDQYDLTLLDGPERALSAYARPETAKAIVSDTLLLAFALLRQRGSPFHHRPLHSRHASPDEYCLMTLIASFQQPSSDLAQEAAAAIGVVSVDFASALAGELIRQIDLGLLVFDRPSLSEFRAIVGDKLDAYLYEEPPHRSDFHFRF